MPLADGARVQLLHTLPLGLPQSRLTATKHETARTLQSLSHVAVSAAHRVGRKVAIGARVTLGRVHAEIVHEARTMAADLIVLGRSRARRIDEWPSYSVLRRVLRHADVPVLVAGTHPPRVPRRIVAAIDLSDHSRRVAELACRVRTADEEPITLVHALRTPFNPWMPSADAEPLLRETQERLAGFSDSLGDRGLVTRVRRGEAWSMIVSEAEHADLVVVGTRGRSALSSAVLGSVAPEVAAHAACDVLIAPALRTSFGPA